MTDRREFETTSTTQRGKSENRPYAEPKNSGERSLISFTGFLLGSFAAMVKQWAYGDKAFDESRTDLNAGHSASPRGSAAAAATPDTDTDYSSRSHGDGGASGKLHLGSPAASHPPASFPDTPTAFVPRHASGEASTHSANDNSPTRMPLRHAAVVDLPHHKAVASMAGSANASHEPSPGAEQAPAPADGGNDAEDPENDNRLRNRAPLPGSSVNLGLANTAIVIGLTDLLTGASDPDSDALSVMNLQVDSGHLATSGKGFWTYTPGANQNGPVTFTYEITDGEFSVVRHANLEVLNVTYATNIIGTELDDTIIGTDGNDTIAAGSGSDVVHAAVGDDIVYGDGGNDVISTGDGNDIVFAGSGNDIIDSGRGNDVVFAGSGDDIVFAGAGDDVVKGEAGNDQITPGAGNDAVEGGDGDDTIFAGVGPDDDTTAAQASSASVSDGDDIIHGDAGVDTYDLSATRTANFIDLVQGTASSQEIGHDSIDGIENIKGGSGDDVMVADTACNEFTGGAGDDTYIFIATSDTPPTPEQWDLVRDFEVGDRLDVSEIDAIESENGHQQFEFRGNIVAYEHAGQIIYSFEARDDGEHTLVRGNTNDDSSDDFIIDLLGHHDLTAYDFVFYSIAQQA